MTEHFSKIQASDQQKYCGQAQSTNWTWDLVFCGVDFLPADVQGHSSRPRNFVEQFFNFTDM